MYILLNAVIAYKGEREREREREKERGRGQSRGENIHILLNAVICMPILNNHFKTIYSILSNHFRMWELGLPPREGSVVFGQLMGMCDHVSYGLGKLITLSFNYESSSQLDHTYCL